MLDVHPPHTATHTWKDFFIHVATICVGLLIAVGLEQTVEAIHHRHQRIELEKNLRRDAELNQNWTIQNIDSIEKIMEWAESQALAVDHAGPSGPLTLQPLALRPISVPNFGVWVEAKTNGQVSLLSTWQQNWLADLNRTDDQMFVSDNNLYGRLRSAFGDLHEQLLSRTELQPSSVLDISSLNAAQRTQVAQQLRRVAESARQLESILLLYATSNEFLIENPHELPGGVNELEENFDRIQHRLEVQHPGTAYTFTTH